MSDEGGWWDEPQEEAQPAASKDTDEPEEEDEGKENESSKNEGKVKARKEPIAVPAVSTEKSEAMKIIEAKQRKHEEEEQEALRVMEEGRRLQREKEDEELRRLKEKQAQRKKEREEEERRMEEQKALIEEQRRAEEEARRQKTEQEKQRKLEEAERKKAAAQAAMSGGRNFVIENKQEGQNTIDKFMNISKAKTEMSLNTGELEALKQRTVMDRVKPLALEDLDGAGLKAKAEEMWKTIIQLETSKYDLVERFKRQEYDLKELNERQRQISHKRHLAQGLDPEAANSRFPPKVQLISKYERRTDRRTFGERKSLFEVDLKKSEQKELIKPKGKVRADWVKPGKGKSTSSAPDDEEGANGDEEGGGGGEVSRKASVKAAPEREEEREEQGTVVEQAEAVAAEDEGDSLW
ncbi:putative Troponin T [Hypsibius exemplaris]|uniref:Troponin T n=1 Tax=Hypsibius exemplaris TaxID=2072580 RepID=A0A1W0WK35_HYPEX|nr:putative Troponin T [Hypsibius exemplaris]